MKRDIIESIIDVGSGFLLAILIQLLIFPLFGLYPTILDSMGIALIFTVVSMTRSAIWRWWLGEMMYELKDYLKAINETKQPLLDTDDVMWEKKYPTFIINRCLSMFYDTIMHSNEMNGLHFLPKRMQFHYFINSIRKKRRFGGKWLSQKKVKDLEVIKEYYGYSNQKAKEALNLLSDDQIENIKLGLKKGGRKK